MLLLDPTHAKKHIPIIASVSEHQPTTWASFFFDLHILCLLFPVGLYYCFKNLEDSKSDSLIFVILYGMLTVYFAGVMVRLMLVLAPISCVLSAIGLSETLKNYFRSFKQRKETEKTLPKEVSIAMIIGIFFLLSFYTIHCIWVTSQGNFLNL
jgi:dolichyl-diphosphooligosaccharide---protein glycosyltransferase